MTIGSLTAAPGRYTRVAIALHWTIALLILFNLGVGFFMEGFAQPLRGTIVALHISSGMTVLALTVVRVAWRITHRPPPLVPTLRPWERHAAHVAHLLLYGLMVVMPLTGWSIISAHPPHPAPSAGGPRLWGLVPLPAIAPIAAVGTSPRGVARQKDLHDDFVESHAIAGYLLLALLLLHVAAALKHQWFDGHDELGRMGLGRGSGRAR